ncbi:MAG: hypothetical protein Q9157_006173 [Trypethelium eluteriae]
MAHKRALSPLRPSRLCNVCREIDFDKFLHRHAWSKKLGSWEQIEESTSCPFCRLVVSALGPRPPNAPALAGERITLRNEKSWKLFVSQSDYDGPERSERYSNKLDLKAAAEHAPGAYTYGLRVSTKSGDYSGLIQRVTKSHEEEKDFPFWCRPVNPDMVNIGLLKSWLKKCQRYHGRSCDEVAVSTTRLPLNLRVIDLEHKCIISAPKNCAYAAISYVWGERLMEMKMPKTLREHVQRMPSGSDYIKLPKVLPRTIRDTMDLAQSLGFRYVWNDSLCIVQDDKAEQKDQMSRMDAVYNSATVTIAAGSSIHADWGLPGISSTRPYAQHMEKVKGFRLASCFPSFSTVDSGTFLTWNTRGWTFQEKLFSGRLLLFTDHQIYFKCKNAIWREDVILEASRPSQSIRRRSSPFAWVADRRSLEENKKGIGYQVLDFLAFGQLNINEKQADLGLFPNYTTAITMYTQRSLTNPSDAINAIAGVLKTLQAHVGQYHAGLPDVYFHQALLWQAMPWAAPTPTDSGYPSWSWAGWEFQYGCVWYLEEMRQIQATLGSSEINELQRSMHLAFVSWYPTQLSNREVSSPCGPMRVLSQEFSGLVSSTARGIGGSDIVWPRLSPYIVQQLGSGVTLLQFSAIPVELRIGKVILEENIVYSPRLQLRELVDHNGDCVGEIWISSHVAASPALTNDFADFITLSWGKGLHQETRIPFRYEPVRVAPPPGPGRAPERASMPRSSWRVANVMLVNWARGFATRVAVGKVIITAWVQQSRDREWVYLG